MPETEITVDDTMGHVRLRPDMYIGPLDRGVPNRLLAESLCMTRAAALNGRCSSVEIAILADGAVRAVDDGPGWDMTIDAYGRCRAEVLLTTLFACRDARDPEHRSHCNTGI